MTVAGAVTGDLAPAAGCAPAPEPPSQPEQSSSFPGQSGSWRKGGGAGCSFTTQFGVFSFALNILGL